MWARSHLAPKRVTQRRETQNEEDGQCADFSGSAKKACIHNLVAHPNSLMSTTFMRILRQGVTWSASLHVYGVQLTLEELVFSSSILELLNQVAGRRGSYSIVWVTLFLSRCANNVLHTPVTYNWIRFFEELLQRDQVQMHQYDSV